MNIGSVISGTMRPEDLIPALCKELETQLETQKPLLKDHRKLLDEIYERIEAKRNDRDLEAANYVDGLFDALDLDSLFDALNEFAPPYHYFGSHPGDGSDYGFWLDEYWGQQLINDGGIIVNDLADVTEDHVGYVAVVNGHGNATLYYRGGNHHMTMVWDIV